MSSHPESDAPRQENIEPSAPDAPRAVAHDEVELLELAASLHEAKGDVVAWHKALVRCQEWFDCRGILADAAIAASMRPADLEALAARVSACAHDGAHCGEGGKDKSRQCRALAPHLREAAITARHAMQASLFDELPSTWILDQDGRIIEANAAAQEATGAEGAFRIVDGCLVPLAPGGAVALRRALLQGQGDRRVSWRKLDGTEVVVRLRALPNAQRIALTLVREPAGAEELAPILARALNLAQRQSQLAANLLAGLTLTDAARAMGISRHTANEHLAAILRRTGASDRKALLSQLRRAAQG